MRTIKKRIRWDPSLAADVAVYRVYVEKEPTAVGYDSQYIEVTAPTTQVVVPDDFPAGTFSEDTLYNMGISALDDLGNESDITPVSAPFDFVAPDAPTNIIVEDL